MNIQVRKLRDSGYVEVKVTHQNVTIDLGLLDMEEQETLAEELCHLLWALGPKNDQDQKSWFDKILRRVTG
jgi:hypothetical protein